MARYFNNKLVLNNK